jgi:hypothetical protein
MENMEIVMSNERLLVRDKIKKESKLILFRNKQKVLLEKKNERNISFQCV